MIIINPGIIVVCDHCMICKYLFSSDYLMNPDISSGKLIAVDAYYPKAVTRIVRGKAKITLITTRRNDTNQINEPLNKQQQHQH